MYIMTTEHERIDLIHMESEIRAEGGQLVVWAADIGDPRGRLTRGASAFFRLRGRARLATSRDASREPPVGVFREKASGVLRLVHKEIILRFHENVKAKRRKQLLAKLGLQIRSRNLFVREQYVVKCKKGKRVGPELLDIANKCMKMDEIVFATPNFVSEYQRTAIPKAEWHLKNTAAVTGQKKGEDVNAAGAWKITQGKPSIIIAVLDDGVEVNHPNLKPRILKNPDPSEPRDKVGRDFFIPDNDNQEHYDPRPKLFQFPFDELAGNDIHGTPCAGVIAAPGKDGGALGIAPKCRILAVKVFHADNLASDARVADAIRYAARHADILSCSWSGGFSTDVEMAINVDAGMGRDGKGSAVFCAAGNGFGNPVAFPARLPGAIAIGASTDQAKLANYSNVGPQIWIVAPSSGGKQGIFATDVSTPNRGFNLGTDAAGGADGLHTNDFGGTSSATPLAAGVGALVLSVKPELKREQLRKLLAVTAEKIGTGYDPTGHSNKFGFGRVDAEAAVKAAKSQ